MKRNREKSRQWVKGLMHRLLVLMLGMCLCSCGSNKTVEESAENEGATGIVKMTDLREVAETRAESTVAGNQEIEVDGKNEVVGTQKAAGYIIKVKDNLYMDTGEISTALRCGMMDGEITSTVASTELPAENDQSNFGSGYGYQYGANDTIEVNMNNEWRIFARFQPSASMVKAIETDVHRITITHGTTGNTLELSPSVQEEAFWEIIEKFEALDVVKSENQTPTVGYIYWLRMYDEAGEELHSITPQGENIEIDNVRYQDYEKGTVARLFLAVDALCGERKAMGELTVSDRQELDTVEGVTMEVTYATSMGANLLLTNTTDKRIVFGDDYSLQTKMDGTWYEVGYIIDNWAFPSIGYEILNGDTRSWSTRWQIFHGELEPGDYRIVKSALDSRGSGDFTKYYLGAEFVVK